MLRAVFVLQRLSLLVHILHSECCRSEFVDRQMGEVSEMTSAIESELAQYFSWYMNEASEGDLIKVPCGPNPDPRLYVGEADDEGWARWRPAKKDEIYDFSKFEEKAGITLHSSIKECFNSFWFCILLVEYRDQQYEMTPVIPNEYLERFLVQTLYYKQRRGNFDFIPIGVCLGDGLLLVDNANGEVVVEDVSGKKTLAASLADFLRDGE